MAETAKQPLLEVRDLKTYFYTDDGVVKAVDGVDFEVYPGEVLGLVGESGCGKSVTSFSILRLVGRPGKIVGGQILFEGRDLLKMPEAEMVEMRGNRIDRRLGYRGERIDNRLDRVGDRFDRRWDRRH